MARFIGYILAVVGLLALAWLAAAAEMMPLSWILILGAATIGIVAFLIWQVDGRTPID